MLTIGITGPTGSGKTTALRVLEGLGGQVIDCDAVYHRLLETDGALLGRIEAAFPGVVRDWTLDRKALGARVYADPAALKRLTDLTWPAVRREVEGRLKGSQASRPCPSERVGAGSPLPESVPTSPAACCLLPVASSKASPSGGRPMTAPTEFAVIDAIGLFESSLAELCDLTAAIVADEDVRVRRLMERDHITEEYARARIAAQKPAEWFAAQADLVLENNGTEQAFAEKCRREFTQRMEKKGFMNEYTYIDLREKPELKQEAAAWFHSKWGVPEEAYLECMDAYLAGETELGWYLCLANTTNAAKNTGDGSLCSGTQRTVPCVQIVGGLGVIENDFHDRKDLRPNVCAMYVEEAHRGRGIAGRLLNLAVEDLRAKGISPVYLVTDHTGFYERYGWEFFCHAQGDGEDHLTRLYIHR